MTTVELKTDMKFRNNDVVKNIKQLQKNFPHITMEYMVEGLLTLWTRHDYSMFTVWRKNSAQIRQLNFMLKFGTTAPAWNGVTFCRPSAKKPETS